MSEPCAELRIVGDLTCCVPDSNSLLTPFVLREQGDWFEEEIRFVRRLVQPGMHVLDIGANYGTYTLTMAAIVGAAGSVHSFEPAAQPIRMLKRSLATNRLAQVVTLHEAGLSNHIGTASLATSANPELNSLTGQQSAEEEIDLTTLDEVFGGCPQRFSFIKMDAEGEEERILEGASRFLAEQDPLIMFELKHGSEINEGLCEAFMRRGFLIHRLLPGPQVLAPIPLGEPLDGFLLNAFAVRPNTEAELIRRGLLVPLRAAMPEAANQVRVQDVIAGMVADPWLEGCRPDWGPDAKVPGWDEHRRAVALARSSEAAGLDATSRVAYLRQASRAAYRALSQGTTGSRLFTAARILLDLGRRAEAVPILNKLSNLVSGEDPSATFREPFLLPDRHHEQLRGLGLRDLVTVATIESSLWHSVFSAYFCNLEQILPLYERASALTGASARTQRTLGLLRDRQRVQHLVLR